MSEEQTTTNNEFQKYRCKGFVSGSEEERKEQISKIKDFFRKKGCVSKTGTNAETGIEEFSPEWDKINNDLGSGDYIIIDDLTDLARNARNHEDLTEYLAAKLLIPLKKGIQVRIVNKEQRKSLNWKESWNKHLANMKNSPDIYNFKFEVENFVLIELKKWLKQIFSDTEKNNEKQ